MDRIFSDDAGRRGGSASPLRPRRLRGEGINRPERTRSRVLRTYRPCHPTNGDVPTCSAANATSDDSRSAAVARE
jgi:hypothetical protein